MVAIGNLKQLLINSMQFAQYILYPKINNEINKSDLLSTYTKRTQNSLPTYYMYSC